MRTAIAEALQSFLDDQHLQVALEYWDLLYARPEQHNIPQQHNIPHFLATVGQLLSISEADQEKAQVSLMRALSTTRSAQA